MEPTGRPSAESDQYVGLIFEHAPIAMALIGLDLRYERVNPSMCAFTGYSERHLIGRPMADLTHPDDLAADTAGMAELRSGNLQTYTVDKRYLTASGAVVWGAKSATLLRRDDGSPVHFIAQILDITDRHDKERVLADDRRRLQEAESVARAGSWEADVATGSVTWSAGLFDLYGIDPDAFDGDYEKALLCIHPDDRAAVFAAVESNKLGQPGRVRYRVTRVNDGALRWFDGRGRPLYEDGKVVRISGAIADVTDQVAAEAELSATHSFQAAVFNASPDMISVWDFPSRSLTWTNRSIPALLGYTPDDVVEMGGTIGNVVMEEDRAGLTAALAKARDASTDEPISVDFRALRKDGSTRWFAQRSAPLHRNQQGRVTQIVGVLRDTTEEVAVAAALSESQALFSQLVRSLDVAFLLRSWDPSEFLYVSPGYEKIFGYDPLRDNVSPADTFKYIHPDDVDRVLLDYWAPSQKGLPAAIDYRFVRPDGDVRWVRAKTAPVPDGAGAFRRSASTLEDVTDIRRSEQARLTSVAEAERANAAKDEFFSRSSHELRTPLNAILGFAQLLEMESPTKDQLGPINHILNAGRHLLGVVDDVLDISRINSKQMDLSMEAVPMGALLTESIEWMKPRAGAAAVTVSLQLDPAAGYLVQADHRRLRQVVLHLLSNAIKYNHPGGVVEVSCQVADTWLDIVVKDSGRGISARNLPRLFTPFDRLGDETAGVDGTGTGLALSERLMTAMGGTLRATSTAGDGSTFTASLPLAAARAGEPSALPDTDAGRPGHTGRTEQRKLVYIEDNSSNILLMEQLVSRRPGWAMVVAGHGALGLELATSTTPDLVLLDLHLPDMDGIDILRKLRADPATRELPVIVVSADANPHQVERLLDAGAREYLTKPVNVAQLLDLLDKPALFNG